MGFFTRRSKWDDVMEATSSAVTGGSLRRVATLGAGIVAGLLSVTAASAAISSARQEEQQ